MSYSIDFRRKVFEVKRSEKLTFEGTAERFKIGIATIFRWQDRLEPKLTRNKRPVKIDNERLAQDVRENPDSYLKERAERFNVSMSGIAHALTRLGISRKKKLLHTLKGMKSKGKTL